MAEQAEASRRSHTESQRKQSPVPHGEGQPEAAGNEQGLPGGLSNSALVHLFLGARVTPAGGRSLAPGGAHTLQPGVAPGRIVPLSVDDWLETSVDVRPLTYTQLVNEIDELVEWLDRQTESSADTVRVEEGLATLRRELAQREARTRPKGRSRRKPKRGRAEEAPLPARRPRILVEMTSVAYEDPAEMRAEYDLIMEWLPRPELSRAERQILEAERDNLAPQLQEERARATSQRRVARLQAALTPTEEDAANALEHAARTITGIVPDPRDPNVFHMYHQNEQIAISAEQFATLRREVANQLRRGHRLIANDIDYYWNRYQAQIEINEDTFLIDDIAGWLGGVSDPGPELRMRRDRALRALERLDAHLSAGRVVQAAAMMAPLERQTQVIRGVSRAFYEGHIEGAERAVRGLEFTRDVSFAIAGSIAAVVVAPVVAGAAAGAGLTGAGAAVATTLGTGVVVGTGTAAVRGTSAVTGHLVAGSSAAEISEAFIGESVRGFKEGFLSGAAGGAARVLGPALGVGSQVGAQVVRRAAAGAIVDGTSAMLEVLMRGGSVEEAVNAGLRSAALGVPGSLVGSAGNRLVRELGGPLMAGAAAYGGAIASGAPPEEAMRAAGVAVTTNVVMSRATHRPETDVRLEQRGRAIGQDIRATARGAASKARRTAAAIMIGTAEPVSAFRSGAGGTTIGNELQEPVVRQLPVRPVEIAEPPAGWPEAPTAVPTQQAAAVVPTQQAAAVVPTQQPAAELDTDIVFRQLGQELATEPSRPPSTAPRRQQIESGVREAQQAGWVDEQGRPVGVGAAIQEHRDAPEVRRALGVTGQEAQSAHVGATSLLRTLQRYSRRLANTVLLPPQQHRAFDQHWLRWIATRRNAIRAFGGTDLTAPLRDVREAQRQALRQTPDLTPEQRGTYEFLLELEFNALAGDLPDGLDTRVPLPAVLGS